MRKTLITAAVASAALVAVAATVPADATGQAPAHRDAASKAAAFKKVATGLNNPRQLNFSRSGKLYIAEAGTGGTQDCRPGPEPGVDVCWGTTGTVTVVSKGHQRRVVKGLPSYANETTGDAALGPADVVPYGKGKLAVSIGYGFDPADRAALASPGNRFGELVRVRLSTHKVRTLGDLAAFERRKNPIHDSNTDPTGVFKWGRSFLATDSGANDLLRVNKKHRVSLVKVFHDVKIPGGKVQAVPTDVVVGPDGAIYVSELTGGPFTKGIASIYRIVPGHRAKVYASGLTNVTSLAFGPRGKLYAVQISNKGLFSPNGSLWRIASDKSGHKSRNVSGPLTFPYGVAIKGHSAYVSTGAIFPGGGEVVKIPLG
jgi:hypothetical protein